MQQGGRWNSAIFRIVSVVLLLALSMAAFYSFSVNNSQRILENNQNYIRDATRQTANRLDDLLKDRLKDARVLAISLNKIIEKPEIPTSLLMLSQETSSFDYVEFIDLEGRIHNAEGQTSMAGDLESFTEGMKGNTGVQVIFNSRITNETLISFYTPVYFSGADDILIGVLCGMCREDSIRQYITTELFSTTSRSYLCMGDGTIISSYGDPLVPVNLLDGLLEIDVVEPDVLENVRAAFANQRSYNYSYQGDVGTGVAALIDLSFNDWMLLQTFPSSVTESMVQEANAVGLELEIALLGLFGLYVLILVWRNFRTRSNLLQENIRLDWTVKGLIPLFRRLVILNLSKNTYEYVANTQSGIAMRGRLADLIEHLSSHYIRTSVSDPTKELLDLENVKSQLKEDKPFLQCEYRILWDEERWENASVICLRRKNGEPTALLLAVQDVTARKKWEREMEQKAKHDEMTSLLHKMATQEAIDDRLERRGNSMHAFYVLDIDNFKEANDLFGHTFGDEVIRRFASTLRISFPENAIIGRVGGDEFVALVEVPDEGWAFKQAETLGRALRQECRLQNGRWMMAASIGVAIAPRDGRTYVELFHCADDELYKVKEKKHGGGRFGALSAQRT